MALGSHLYMTISLFLTQTTNMSLLKPLFICLHPFPRLLNRSWAVGPHLFFRGLQRALKADNCGRGGRDENSLRFSKACNSNDENAGDEWRLEQGTTI